MTAIAALITWILNTTVGFAVLARWLARHRAAPGPSTFPPPLVFFHLASASLGLALWIAYLSTGRQAALAWLAFLTLNVVNGLGDTALTRGWRRRHPEDRRSPVRDYVRAAGEALSGKRPAALVHGLLAGVTYFVVLLAALGIGD